MKRIYLLAYMGMFFFYGYSQNSLSGTINCCEHTNSLEGVSIYFPQLEKGSTTDSEGKYILQNLPLGEYKIIASYLGFKTYSKTIQIQEGINTLDILLHNSAIEIEEVIVSTPFHKLQRENVMKVEQASVVEFKNKGAITLADGITNIAGVESVSTGIGIGKPVIRGLSSNRVLVYTQGIRLENQQFGDEHGLGIGDAGIESVEVIKGPASLLYGSDALGGVLYLNPERFAVANTTSGDVNLNYFTNTLGFNANAGFKTSSDKFKFLIRGGVTSHADYKTGDDERVTNSRYTEYHLKTGLGYQTSNFKTALRYNYTDSDLGIAEEIGVQNTERTPLEPYQEITSHIISSKNTLFFEKSSIEATLGYIFNNRKEFEEGEEGPALEMDLATFNYNLQYNLPKFKNLETIVGIQGMRQTNENSGEEILIPDAITNDIGVLATSHLHLGNTSDVQFGIRYDHRSIIGEENGIPTEEGFIDALDRTFNSFNVALGYKINITENITGRINTATGFRAPNLAELTSNGVHEGTNRFEIGNPNLDNEQNFQIDLALEYQNEHVEFFINGFHNGIDNFIFIEPNGGFVDGDAVFLYSQQNARLYGGEIGIHIHPHPIHWLHIESSFATVTGKQDDDEFLPLIPANNITNTLRFEFENTSWLTNAYSFITLQSYFDTDNISDFETPTDGYNLLNLGLGGNVSLGKQKLTVRVSGNNILNTNYVSHLSRLKSDGIANIGRNISVGVSVPL